MFDCSDGPDCDRFLAGIQVGRSFDDILAQKLKNLLLKKANLINGPQPISCVVETNKPVLYKLFQLRRRLPSVINTKIHTANPFKIVTRELCHERRGKNIAHFVRRKQPKNSILNSSIEYRASSIEFFLDVKPLLW
ncbi:hypothetical protein ES703_61312 [subsurface metagenome]